MSATIRPGRPLILRPPQAEDAKAVTTLANDIRIAQNTTRIPYPYALSDARAWLRRTMEHGS